jgi:TP901 family phage tail tape measure protein
LVVETAFTACQDQVTAQLKMQAKAASNFGKRAKLAFQQATKQSSIFRSMLGANLLSRAITGATSAMTRGVRTLVEEFVSFDDAIGQAAAKMPERLKRGTEAFKELETAAREVGKQTKFSATEAAEGLNFLAMAGFNAEQSIAVLPQVTDLATASSMDLGRATDIATDALGAFGLMTKDTTQLTTNLARVNDVFAATVTSANVDMEMLFESMKDGGPALTAAGQSIETFAALVGKMGSAGIKGGKAGMTLKNIMLQLAGPTAGAQKALDKLGVEISDADGNMRDIIDILGDYRKATADMGSVQRDATTDLIFGRRAISGVNILLQEGEDELKAYRDQLENAGGAAGEMAKEIEQSLGNKLLALKSAAIELGFQLLESFKGEGKEGIDALIEAVRNFDMKPIIEGTKTLVDTMRWLFRLVRDNFNTIKVLVAGIVAFKVALGAINFVKAITGFQKLGAAVGGVGAPGAPGVPKPGVPGAPPGKITPGGAVPGAVAALSLGAMVGTIFEENFLGPLRKAGETTKVQLGNLILQMEGIGRGAKKIDEMSVEEMFESQKKIALAIKNAESPVSSIEDAAAQLGSGAMGVATSLQEFFGLITEEEARRIDEMNKGPVQMQQEQMERLIQLYMEMAQAIVAAKAKIDASAKAATTEINVNVGNAPPNTTVEAKGETAPKVNQKKAGKT